MRIAYRLTPALLLAACTGGERADSGQCPAGEVCSTETPNGLHFVGAQSADGQLTKLTAAAATAIGGTQEIELMYDPGNGVQIDLDLPYKADDDGGIGVAVDSQAGPIVTLKGVGSRQNYLRITEPSSDLLMDRKEMSGAALSSIGIVSTSLETLPGDGSTIAWAVGAQKIGVALYGQVQEGSSPTTERIVDQSMSLDADGGTRTRWDEIDFTEAAATTLTLNVRAGDKPAAAIPVNVVETADAIDPINPQTVIPQNQSATLCFAARSGDDVVVGFPWQFTIDGASAPASIASPNCVLVTATKPSGQIEVAAQAGGQTATVEVTVGQSAVRAPAKIERDRGTNAGERASL